MIRCIAGKTLVNTGAGRGIGLTKGPGGNDPGPSLRSLRMCDQRQGARRVPPGAMKLTLLVIDDHLLFGLGFAHALTAAVGAHQ